jgi:hypothetical protein
MVLKEKKVTKKGCGIKIIFQQFDTIVLIAMCHFLGDEID